MESWRRHVSQRLFQRSVDINRFPHKLYPTAQQIIIPLTALNTSDQYVSLSACSNDSEWMNVKIYIAPSRRQSSEALGQPQVPFCVGLGLLLLFKLWQNMGSLHFFMPCTDYRPVHAISSNTVQHLLKYYKNTRSVHCPTQTTETVSSAPPWKR